MKYRVSLGMVLNIGNYNSVRAEVTAEADDYLEAFEESRARLYDAAYHLAKEVNGGVNMAPPIEFLASKLTEEPRL